MSSESIGPRQRQKARTRAALRQAAQLCFVECGYSQTQVGDIAKRAGVAHGTFYVHFADKEQVLDELLADFNDALVAKLEKAWPDVLLTDPWGLTRTVAEICLDHWHGDAQLVAAFAQRAGVDGSIDSLRDGINPPVAAFLSAKLRQLTAALERPLPDAELVAQALLGMWTRIGMQHVFGGLAKDKAATLLANLSLGALASIVPSLSAFLAPNLEQKG